MQEERSGDKTALPFFAECMRMNVVAEGGASGRPEKGKAVPFKTGRKRRGEKGEEATNGYR